MLALVAAWLWLVPRVVEALLLSQLLKVGFGQVHIESIEVGFGHVTVRNLELSAVDAGAGTVTIGAVTAAFTLVDLLHARIDTLMIDDPTWNRTAMPGRASSPFDDVLRKLPPPTRPLPALPMRHFAIRGGRIATPPDSAAATVDTTLTVAAGQWSIDLDASVGTHLVHATARLHEEQEHAAGTVVMRVLEAQPIELAGTCQLELAAAERLLALDLRRRPGPFEVSLADDTWSGDGDLELHASVPFAHLDAATFVVRVEDFRLASTTGMQVTGLATEAHLQGLPMPMSTGPQQVRWQSVQCAAVQAGSGTAEFDLQHGPELRVRIRQRLDEIGSIDIGELRLAPGVRSFPTTVAFDQVPLQEWLELLSGGRVTGEGRLSGSLKLIVQTEPRLSIDLQAGQLAAAPGGVVRFLEDAETAAMIRQHVQQIAAATGYDALVQERLVKALEEFTYTALDFHIDPDAGGEGVTLRVHATGEGRRVPQQLDLDVNLHGFDAAVDTAIAIKLGLDRVKDHMTDKIDHQPKGTRVPRKP